MQFDVLKELELEDVGAGLKRRRSCLYEHIPFNSESLDGFVKLLKLGAKPQDTNLQGGSIVGEDTRAC